MAKPRTCFVHEKPWRRLILVVHLRYRCGACARCGGSRTILARMRHEHCGGRAAKAELRTGAEAASGGLVRRIVLRGE